MALPTIASLAAEEALVMVAFLFLGLLPGAITALKGRLVWFVGGFFIGIVWLVPPFRLAKPNSPWARRFYSAEKLDRARDRYPEVDPADPDRSKLALAIGFGLFALAILAGFVSGLSES